LLLLKTPSLLWLKFEPTSLKDYQALHTNKLTHVNDNHKQALQYQLTHKLIFKLII